MAQPEFDELSYATSSDPAPKRWLMRTIENLSGRRRVLPIYHRWRDEFAGKSPRMWHDALDLIGTKLDVQGPDGWKEVSKSGPLIVVANHPFGIADGISLLAIAESLGRPYRILINADFMRVPEVRSISLPIDFAPTKEAVATNLKSRAEARKLLKEGVTIVIFPAGGVATAESPFGQAEDLPWKQFAARLVEQSEATVLPVYFEGQNSALFHFVSRYSLTLRLSLLVCEFGRYIGGTVRARVGAAVPYADIKAASGAGPLIDELYVMVHRLAPGRADAPREKLHPRPAAARRRFPWDEAQPGRNGKGRPEPSPFASR